MWVRGARRRAQPRRLFLLSLCLEATRDWLEPALRDQRPKASTTHAWRGGGRGELESRRAGTNKGVKKEDYKTQRRGFLPRSTCGLAPEPAQASYWSGIFSPIGPRAKGLCLPQDMPAPGGAVKTVSCDAGFRHLFGTGP